MTFKTFIFNKNAVGEIMKCNLSLLVFKMGKIKHKFSSHNKHIFFWNHSKMFSLRNAI